MDLAVAHYAAIGFKSAAVALSVFQLIRQRRSFTKTAGTFSFLVLFLVLGWLIVEVVGRLRQRSSHSLQPLLTF